MKPDLEAGASPRVPTDPRKDEALRLVVIAALAQAMFIAMVVLVLLLPVRPDRLQIYVPTFSVSLAGFDGLDRAMPQPPPVVSPTFNLTLHGVSSSRSSESCEFYNERGTVAVSYAGAVLAWGRVAEFCVAEGARKHVRMVALGAGVELSDELRSRMASERRSRSAEVDVDIVLDSYLDDWKRFLSCRVKLDDEPSSRQPSPCKVLVSDQW
uniref:Uncharacterized protein n=1 Tax=Avena sativa TaxID=4498 RepID=A0ACD5V626_AVESA